MGLQYVGSFIFFALCQVLRCDYLNSTSALIEKLFFEVLSFLQFRVKEVAELLNLSTNTVVKYRTNIMKKVDSKVISDLIR